MFHTSASGQPGRMAGIAQGSYNNYNLRMNGPPANHFGHPQPQPLSGHPQHPQHSQHPQHPAGAYQNQHHSIGSGAVVSAGSVSIAAPQYGLGHGPGVSGSPGNSNAISSVSKNCSDHWASQLQLYQVARENTVPHAHARANNTHGKQLGAALGGSASDADKEDRNRNVSAFADRQSGRPPFAELDLGGQNLRNLSVTLFNYSFLTKLWLGHNKLTVLPGHIGRLRALTHLDLSFNQLHELPAEIGMLSNLEELLLFDNNLDSLPPQVGFLSHLTLVGLEGNPLREELRAVVVEKDSSALVRYLRETAPPPTPPRAREWLVLDDTPVPSHAKMTVLTYNSLCDRYATSSQYGYTPLAALEWSHRRDLIMAEMELRNADVICLQEIDHRSFRDFFRPQLAERGYDGIYWPKSRAKTMCDSDADKVDGCATFFRTRKLILLETEMIDFANLAINRPDMKGEHDVFNRVMPRDDIAVVAFLEHRATGARMIVVNAHIFWNETFKDVKVIQVAILMERIAALSKGYARKPALSVEEKRLPVEQSSGGADGGQADGDVDPSKTAHQNGVDAADDPDAEPEPGPSQEYNQGSQIPVIICGDFNSKPDSGVYSLISQGALSHSHDDLMDRKYGSFTRDGMAHPFGMKSSYSHMGELAFTNYTPNFVGVIDYIWYSTNAFTVAGLLGDVDKTYLSRVPGFPNHHFPSDHIALMAEFLLKPRNEQL